MPKIVVTAFTFLNFHSGVKMPGRILVVDDEQSMCEFMEIMLTKEGYDVVTSVSSHEAIQIIRSSKVVVTALEDVLPAHGDGD